MSKFQALKWAVLCIALAILFGVIHLSMCIAPFLILALVFGCISGAKYYRDYNLAHTASKAPPTAQLMPPMTSPGSHRLFVPDPLDRRP